MRLWQDVRRMAWSSGKLSSLKIVKKMESVKKSPGSR